MEFIMKNLKGNQHIWAMVDGHPIHNKDPKINGYYKSRVEPLDD